MRRPPSRVLGARISPQVLWVLAISAAAWSSASRSFFRSTLMGRAMRACSSNPTAARLCGIRASTLVTLSFFIAAAMGALAGCAVSPLTQTQYDMGTSLAVKGFTCAVLGGLGNVTAAVAAGLLVGVLETASISVLPLAYKDVVALGHHAGHPVLPPRGPFRRTAPGARRVTRSAAGRYLPLSPARRPGARLQLILSALKLEFLLTQLTMAAYYTLVTLGLCLLMGYAGRCRWGTRGSLPSAGTRRRCFPPSGSPPSDGGMAVGARGRDAHRGRWRW